MNKIKEFVDNYVFYHDGGMQYRPDNVEKVMMNDAISQFMTANNLSFAKEGFSFNTYLDSDKGVMFERDIFLEDIKEGNVSHDSGYFIAYKLDDYGSVMVDKSIVMLTNNLPAFFDTCDGVVFYGSL